MKSPIELRMKPPVEIRVVRRRARRTPARKIEYEQQPARSSAGGAYRAGFRPDCWSHLSEAMSILRMEFGLIVSLLESGLIVETKVKPDSHYDPWSCPFAYRG